MDFLQINHNSRLSMCHIVVLWVLPITCNHEIFKISESALSSLEWVIMLIIICKALQINIYINQQIKFFLRVPKINVMPIS